MSTFKINIPFNKDVEGFIKKKTPTMEVNGFSSIIMMIITEDGWSEEVIGGYVSADYPVGIADVCDVGDYVEISAKRGEFLREVKVTPSEKMISARCPGVAQAYVSAWKCAKNFGHGWAMAFENSEEIVDLLDSCETLQEFTCRTDLRAKNGNWEYGWITTPIPVPHQEIDGNPEETQRVNPWEGWLVESTGTGRSTWRIPLSGISGTLIEISRPQGIALTAWVNEEGLITLGVNPEVSFGARHMAAFEELLKTLGARIGYQDEEGLNRLARMGDAIETFENERRSLVLEFNAPQ